MAMPRGWTEASWKRALDKIAYTHTSVIGIIGGEEHLGALRGLELASFSFQDHVWLWLQRNPTVTFSDGDYDLVGSPLIIVEWFAGSWPTIGYRCAILLRRSLLQDFHQYPPSFFRVRPSFRPLHNLPNKSHDRFLIPLSYRSSDIR